MDIFCTFSTHCFSKNYYRNFFFLKDKQLVGMHIYTNMLEYYGDVFTFLIQGHSIEEKDVLQHEGEDSQAEFGRNCVKDGDL